MDYSYQWRPGLGKLKEVVRHIFDEGGNSNKALKAWGIEIESSSDEVSLWHCNIKTVELFVAIYNQLRTTMGGILGLDYTAVKVGADALNIDFNSQIFYGIKACEEEFLQIINKDKK